MKRSPGDIFDLPRHERTLKERLAAGQAFEFKAGRFVIARMKKISDRIVMSGFTGVHSLDFTTSTSARIESHWKSFCDACRITHRQTKNRYRRR
jgi:hypothetical protein